ncbi:MAG: hypothetical protein DSY80_01045, partial [Desulfocapsa sp.]
MAVTGASGTFSWGPQVAKGTVATTWYRHKAVMVDMAPIDDVRLGQLEVGSDPVPTFPYKAGVVSAGGALLQPRLEGDLGWLLYGMLGKVTTTDNYVDDGVVDDVTLLVGAQNGYTTGVTDPPSAKAVFVKVSTSGSGTYSGTVTIHGTVGGSADTEDIVMSGVAEGSRTSGTKLFTEVSSIDFPAYDDDGDVLSVG